MPIANKINAISIWKMRNSTKCEISMSQEREGLGCMFISFDAMLLFYCFQQKDSLADGESFTGQVDRLFMPTWVNMEFC